MSRSEFIGIALSGDDLKIAHLRVEKKRLELISTETVTLVTPLNFATPAGKPEPAEEEPEDMDELFGLDDDDSEINLDDAIGGEDDGFDMTEEGSEDPGGGNNEILLETVLNNINPKAVKIGLNIPFGSTIFQILRDNDYKTLKSKERKVVIEEKLNSIYDQPISPDNYGFQVRDDGSLLLASFENEIPLLNLLDQVATHYKGNLQIRDVQADEASLVGLVRANYHLQEDEYTGIVHIGETSSRVIFLKGNTIFMVLPMINQGSKSTRILNTVFSKMLFEIDKGELPNVDRLIITDHGGLGEKACDFFRKQLKDVEVENLQYHPDKFINPEAGVVVETSVKEELDEQEEPGEQEEQEEPDDPFASEAPEEKKDNGKDNSHADLASYSTAIGLAWSASGLNQEAFPQLSFVPGYVADRQRVFKLEWHGVMLLLMIAGIPFVTNSYYQANQDQIQVYDNEIRLLNSQINESRPIATITEELATRMVQLDEQLERYNTLSENAYKWSVTLDILNSGLRSVRNTWVTQIRSANEGIIIEGYSLYRNRIPRLANKFDKATVQSVTEGEMRNKKIYRYVILVDKIAENDNFTPPEAVPPANISEMINIGPLIENRQ